MKKIILILFICLVFPLNVNGAVGDTYSFEHQSGSAATIRSDGKNNKKISYYIGGGDPMYLYNINGTNEKTAAYCVDPMQPTPNNVKEYKEISTGGRSVAAYKSVFENTCTDDDFSAIRIAALKAIAMKLTETSGRNYFDENGKNLSDIIEFGYADAMDPNTTATFNGGNYNIQDLQRIVNTAYNAVSLGKSSNVYISEISSNNEKSVFSVNHSGGITDIECSADNATCKQIEEKLTSTTFEITATSDTCESVGSYTAKITYKDASGTEASSSDCTCTPRFFEAVGEGAGKLQQLVTCDPNTTGQEKSLEKTFECKVEDECQPYSRQLSSSTDGFHYCDASGQTIIEIYELLEENSEEENYGCVKDGRDYADNDITASKLILGNDVDNFKADGNNICDVYCVEDYELKLPGPTANGIFGNEEVFINAGTFFNIEANYDNMYDQTTVKCYGTPRYDVLEKIINAARKRTMDAFNNYQYYLVGQTGKCYTSTCEDSSNCVEYDPDNPNVCLRYGTMLCYPYKFENKNLPKYEFASDGSIKESGIATLSGSGGWESFGVCETQLSNAIAPYNNAEENLENAIINYTGPDGVKGKTLDFWKNKCMKWDFTGINNAVYKIDNYSANNASITFDYYDGMNFKNPTIKPVTKETVAQGTLTNVGETNKNLKVGYCDYYGCDKSNETTSVETANYNHNQEKIKVSYGFDNNWCNKYNGTIEYIEELSKCEDGSIIEGFPVDIETPQGVYWYEYDFSGIGHYFNDDSGKKVGDTGRLETVLNQRYSTDTESFTNFCNYNVNDCKNCGVECDPSGECTIGFATHECNKHCQVACVGGGCILDINAGFLATYRTISLNKNTIGYIPTVPSPNSIMLAWASIPIGNTNQMSKGNVSSTKNFAGNNWQTTKGKETMNKIIDAREEIYNRAPEFAIDLTPSVIQEIKEYNQETNYTDFDKGEYTSSTTGKYAIYHSDFMEKYFQGQKSNTMSYNGDYINIPFTGPAWK